MRWKNQLRSSLAAYYAKQNHIVRFIAIRNREELTICANTINNCCRYPFMSLQIH